MPAKIFQIELNEINFDFVRRYIERGALPNFTRLIDRHGVTETISERDYEHLEPWIQWVTAHTGLTFADHKVFRLGDIVDRDLDQIWEILERNGLSVGAVSPMNAKNRTRNAAFFVPDPWTVTETSGGRLLKGLAQAAANAVNENANSRIGARDLVWLAAAAVRYAPLAGYAHYARLASSAARGRKWAKAQILDELLADVAIAETRSAQPDYVSLFLNAGAHIQHHYMFNAAVYDGEQSNPEWLVAADADPLFDVYAQYDRILGRIGSAFPDYRLIVATGLHQDPYPDRKFYWRLRDHAAFLALAGVPFERVEPRMSRDFLIHCRSADEAIEAQDALAVLNDGAGTPLFEIDNRGATLFVMLTYPHDVDDRTRLEGPGLAEPLRPHVAFVAIKNGEHNGVGYVIDTGAQAVPGESIPLGDLAGRVARHFGVDWPPSSDRADRGAEALTHA